MSGAYTLPFGVQSSATVQSNPPPPISATATFRNAQIAPSLGRNLAAGANGTANINVVEPGTLFGERLYQMDFRFGKLFSLGGFRWQAYFDLYNRLEQQPGAVAEQHLRHRWHTWQVPLTILPARLVKFEVRMSF